MSFYYLGLDLGQAVDYTALAVIEKPQRSHQYPWHAEPDRWNLVHLERPALGTPYTRIVERLRMLLATSPLRDNSHLVIDATGCGAPVVDMLREADLGVPITPVVITGGDAMSLDGYKVRVPKRDLVGAIAVLLQQGKLKICPHLQLAGVLARELQSFTAKISPKGNDTYEAWREGDHDDLVLAVALACWYSSQPSREIQFE